MANLNIRKPVDAAVTQPAKMFRLSRRKFIFLSAAAAVALPACHEAASPESQHFAAWPDIDIPEIDGPGYGWHFDYFELTEGGAWPRILTNPQKAQLEKLSDLILPASDTAPAPSEVGVVEFWDEWISAPYSAQARTRDLALNGLVWIENQYQKMFKTDFLSAKASDDIAFMDVWSTISRDDEDHAKIRKFFEHMRYLTLGAYYTTPQGAQDLGAVPNVPLTGDYPGPSPQAQAHLESILKDIGITL